MTCRLVLLSTGQSAPLPHADFQAIDADSSPIRYRACFTTAAQPADAGRDLSALSTGPCRCSRPTGSTVSTRAQIGAALEQGRALAFLGTENIRYGIDRIVAVMPDGRGFVWHQINRCGDVVFDGQPAPADCPAPPQEN